MRPVTASPALRDRLGPQACADLENLFHASAEGWRDEVLSIAADRFERSLAAELARSRVELARGFAGMRDEMQRGLGAVREELAANRIELLKWSFLFWVGQIVIMAGILSFMLRGAR